MDLADVDAIEDRELVRYRGAAVVRDALGGSVLISGVLDYADNGSRRTRPPTAAK